MKNTVDKVIIGAGIYGLYAAFLCAQKNEKVLVLEYEGSAFSRASHINQGRIHRGYHYPRSLTTALDSSDYFDKFVEEFSFCLNKEFHQIYAISNSFSWLSARQYMDFCRSVEIPYEKIGPGNLFKEDVCDGIFKTQEYACDTLALRNFFVQRLSTFQNCIIQYNSRISRINKVNGAYTIDLEDGTQISCNFIINTAYSSINQIQNLLGFAPFPINYELCELILCKVSTQIQNIGITIMDGPFFSLTPYGKTGYHILSAVHYTPHLKYEGHLPVFKCQNELVRCNKYQLENCNNCINKPTTNWHKMIQLVKKYLNDEIEIKYLKSLFAMKAVLMESELDDSRPTIVKQFSQAPYFYSVFSGKINCIYELNKILV